MTLEDILNADSQTFPNRNIKDFLERNEKHIISGVQYCEDHDIDFWDMLDAAEDIIRENANIYNVDTICDEWGDAIESPEIDDLHNALNSAFSGTKWREWCRSMEKTLDIPFYKDGNKIIVLPFVTFENEEGSKVYTDLAGLCEAMIDASGLEKEDYDFEYAYNYGHDQIEEWWDDGEGTFNVEADYPSSDQIKSFFTPYQEEVDKFLAKTKNKDIERE